MSTLSKVVLAIVLTCVFALVGCGDPDVTAGTVVSRSFMPAHDWDTQYQQPVYGYGQSCSGYGTSRSCYSTSYVMYYYPVTEHHHADDTWSVQLEACKMKDDEKKCHRQWHNVTQIVYDRLENGSYYNAKGQS